jgi:hypothetical protein
MFLIGPGSKAIGGVAVVKNRVADPDTAQIDFRSYERQKQQYREQEPEEQSHEYARSNR